MTIEYYNENAEDFYEFTVNADLSEQYKFFTKYLPSNGVLLDCGCGSGRETKHFMEQGYEVVALDASEELCKKAEELTDAEVLCMRFDEIEWEDRFDGIWACASLLQVPSDELPDVFRRLSRALKPKGILYVSFKLGGYEGERDGRFYTDLNEDGLRKLIDPGLMVLETYISEDVRLDRNEKWLNAII